MPKDKNFLLVPKFENLLRLNGAKLSLFTSALDVEAGRLREWDLDDFLRRAIPDRVEAKTE